MRLRLLLALSGMLLLAACPQDEEKDPALEPVEFTPGVAVAEPATPTNAAIEVAVAYDGTRTHLVYCQNDGAGDHDIMYTARVGAGSFALPAPVFPGSVVDSREPHVCLDGTGTLHIVWEEGTSPNREIYYATINASGSISAATPLTATTEDEANPRVHVDSTNRVHVVWEGSTPPPTPTSSIFYRRTQASVFLAAVVLPKANGSQPAEMPDICTDAGDRVYVVWSEQNGSARNIRLLRSDDNGANFGATGNGFAAHGGVDLTQPRIAGGTDGEIFLVFIGQDSQGERAVFATFTRTGYSMASPGQLSNNQTGGIRDPSIAVHEQSNGQFTVVVAWNDGGATGGNMMVHASHDSGEHYPGDPTDLSQGNTQPASNRRPMIAVDDNELIAAWDGQPQGGGVVRAWLSNSSYKLPKKK